MLQLVWEPFNKTETHQNNIKANKIGQLGIRRIC